MSPEVREIIDRESDYWTRVSQVARHLYSAFRKSEAEACQGPGPHRSDWEGLPSYTRRGWIQSAMEVVPPREEPRAEAPKGDYGEWQEAVQRVILLVRGSVPGDTSDPGWWGLVEAYWRALQAARRVLEQEQQAEELTAKQAQLVIEENLDRLGCLAYNGYHKVFANRVPSWGSGPEDWKDAWRKSAGAVARYLIPFLVDHILMPKIRTDKASVGQDASTSVSVPLVNPVYVNIDSAAVEGLKAQIKEERERKLLLDALRRESDCTCGLNPHSEHCPAWWPLVTGNIPEQSKQDGYYCLIGPTGSVFVKEEDFFILQGGLTEPWGKNWFRVTAGSIEEARKKGEEHRDLLKKAVQGEAKVSQAAPAETAPDARSAAIRAEREKRYGHFHPNHENVGLVWQGILSHHYGKKVPPIPAQVVALMMSALKLVRAAHPLGEKHSDNYEDAIGYATIAEDCAKIDASNPQAYPYKK